MQLQKVYIHREEYGARKGELRGTIEFASGHGKVQLALDGELSAQIVRLCADGIIRASQDVAAQMTADVIDGLALPAPEEKNATPQP